MNPSQRVARPLLWSVAILSIALAMACSSRDPILGGTGGAGLPYAAPLDKVRPQVTTTSPATTVPGPTLVAPTNDKISATFTKAMAPATFTGTTFTVVAGSGPQPSGTVSYDVNSMTAFYMPIGLVVGTTYTATITSAVTDLAGNALAGVAATPTVAADYVWTFTATAADAIVPTITLTNPAALATNVPTNATVNATFSKAMDPATIVFTVALTGPPLGSALLGTTVYNSQSHIVTFTPTSPFASSSSYTATITGAKDLAGNALAAGLIPNPWTFTTGTVAAPGAVNLGAAGTFGIMATSAITNTGAATKINGDVSLEPGTSCGLLPVQVNGSIHINDTVSHKARTDLLVAYNYAKTLPPGITISGGADLGALYPLGIAPGTYTSGSTMLVSTPLVLDAGGNANAAWFFQIGSSLTTTASVSLKNGAQAKNVFWVPTLDGTVGVGTIFYGTIVSGRDVTAKTGAVINGRILAGATLAGTIALDTNTVNVPL